MNRRCFLKSCGTTALMAGAMPALLNTAWAQSPVQFERVKLVGPEGAPLKASTLAPDEYFLFHYPYQGTPCFLIHLGQGKAEPCKLSTAEGQEYEWKGGVGPRHAIVAFSAICAHQLAYAREDAAIISYNAGKSEIAGRSGVITCCAHGSIYDPSRGAQVLGGPAPGPLAAIALEYDEKTDELWATAVYGGSLFTEFFKAYRADLNAALGPGRYREPVTGTAPISKITLSIPC